MGQGLQADVGTRRRARAVDAVRGIHACLVQVGWDGGLRLWDGTSLGPGDAAFRVVLRAPWSLRAMFPATDLSLGEAYLDDVFDVEGSMVEAMRAIAGLGPTLARGRTRRELMRLLLRLPRPPARSRRRRWLALPERRAHSLERDREVISYHYDVGNDFYRLFLDERLVYSCAYFADADDGPPGTVDDGALERAQVRKLDLVCRKLGLQPGQRLLDVGCGWGALVVRAAEEFGVRALGITLSEEQAGLAREVVAARGLSDLVEVRVSDYREVEGTFDAVASIGMVEHVGSRHLDGYFRRLFDLTAPGGRLLNHGITTGGRGVVRDFAQERDTFIGRHVFPDGALVPSAVMLAHAEAAGFEVVDLEQLRPHYARTLEHWVHRLERAADEAAERASDRHLRTWRAYMAGSVVGFESNDLGVIQLLCSRGARLPLGRDWLTSS